MAKRGATKRRGVVSAQMTGIKSGAPGVSWRIQNQLWGREASGHRSNVYRGLCLALSGPHFFMSFLRAKQLDSEDRRTRFKGGGYVSACARNSSAPIRGPRERWYAVGVWLKCGAADRRSSSCLRSRFNSTTTFGSNFKPGVS